MVLAGLVGLVGVLLGMVLGAPPTAAAPDAAERQEVVDGYRWDYLWHLDAVPGVERRELAWSGSVAECRPGPPAPGLREASLRGLNWIRSMAGLPAVRADATQEERAQAAALMMSAQQSLSHTPSGDWACFSDEGAAGARNSNLALGHTDLRSVLEGYLDDPGQSNRAVGHRRWLLSPGAERMGVGVTDDTNAWHVLHGNRDYDGPVGFLAYPVVGHWPRQLATSRWSLSHTGTGGVAADFSSASVEVTRDGATVPVEIGNRDEGGAGHLATISWDLDDPQLQAGETMDTADVPDAAYEVVVHGIRLQQADGTVTETSHRYTVSLVDALGPTFGDIRGSAFGRDVVWLQWQGWTRGCSPSRFCPDASVTRGQMAAFLGRALDLGEAPATASFVDTTGHTFEDEIDALVAAGITTGCAADRFCPDEPVTRGQMAAFLERALAPEAVTAAASFVDTTGHTFEDEIASLSAAGVTTGCGTDGDRFCPQQPVTRGQMAAFLRRAAS